LECAFWNVFLAAVFAIKSKAHKAAKELCLAGRVPQTNPLFLGAFADEGLQDKRGKIWSPPYTRKNTTRITTNSMRLALTNCGAQK